MHFSSLLPYTNIERAERSTSLIKVTSSFEWIRSESSVNYHCVPLPLLHCS